MLKRNKKAIWNNSFSGSARILLLKVYKSLMLNFEQTLARIKIFEFLPIRIHFSSSKGENKVIFLLIWVINFVG